jgi:copper chaperone CopZ
MALSAVHIRTRGFQCELCPEVIRHALKGLPGVLDVVAVPSMKLTSVLYDPAIVVVGQLRDRLARCGYRTESAGQQAQR